MTSMLKVFVLYILCASSAWAALLGPPQITCDMQVDDATYGLIVVSSMIPDSELASGVPNKISYAFNNAKGSFLTDRSIMTTRTVLFRELASDFEGSFGRLHVLKLKAGDYEWRGWGYMDRMNYQWQAPQLKAIPFHVTAGRATYLGSFEPHLFTGENLLGQDVARAWPTLVDQSKRDLSVLFQKCPAIDIMQVDVSPLDLTPWLQK